MPQYDIILLTESRYIDPNAEEAYKKEVLREDELLMGALKKQGISSLRVDWADPDFDWSVGKKLMFRSTWDYFYQFEAFKKWLEARSETHTFINPLSIVHWNMDKHYLRDLEEKGVSIVPTRFVEKGETVDLATIYAEQNAEKIIIKPAVSGTARHTYLIDKNNLQEHEEIFGKLIREECMLVEPFLQNIVDKGEVSMVVFDGKFSHAILKQAKKGDFRVQSDFGGTLSTYHPSKEEVRFAEGAVAACNPVPVYGRVDVARDDAGKMLLVELELIEPDMWLRVFPGSEEKLAAAVAQHLIK